MRNPLKHWSRDKHRRKRVESRLERLEALVGTGALSEAQGAFTLYRRLGLTLLLDQRCLVDRTLVESGVWEPDQIACLFALADEAGLGERSVFLDIGAFWGLYALLAARRGFSRVVAFEPDRTNFAQLQAQLFLNDRAQTIDARNVAVSDAEGVLGMGDSRAIPDGNRGGASVVAAGAPGPVTVPCLSIDGALNVEGATLLAKIDAEGHEAQVLRGMRATIASNRVILQIEVHPQNAAIFDAEVAGLSLRRLCSIGVDRFYTNVAGLAGDA